MIFWFHRLLGLASFLSILNQIAGTVPPPLGEIELVNLVLNSFTVINYLKEIHVTALGSYLYNHFSLYLGINVIFHVLVTIINFVVGMILM